MTEVRFSGNDPGNAFKGGLHVGNAVHTHHSVNFYRSFHCFLYLLFGFIFYRSFARKVELQPAKAKGVSDNADGGKAHCGGSEHGAQLPVKKVIENPRRQRDSEAVIEKRPEEVLADIFHNGS